MVSTAVYPALGTHIPAATSRHVVTDLRRLGFEGAIITDALQTPAVNQFFTTGDAAVRAVQVGVDLVLTAGTTGSTYDTDVETSAYAALVAATKSGRLDTSTLRDAYEHVLRLKTQLN
jgi:beta-N-acetylhexosaminidase